MTEKQMNIFFEIHSGLDREAPGSRDATEQAFRTVASRSGHPEIFTIYDIGCGPGAQTLQLAELSSADIYAVDTHQPFLDRIAEAARRRQLSHRIHPVNADMNRLPFSDASADLIWSEGAVYIMGFERGLLAWQSLLKPGGFLVVSELSWLKNSVPDELRLFWEEEYPAMQTRERNECIVEDAGYSLIDSFVLPESGWRDGYYSPLERRIERLEIKYHQDPEALEVIETEKKEIDMYRRFSSFYGYVFYIVARIG
jgi:SAM-dependent methyltransferase